MKTDGYTRICGLIGNPVEHTVSPVIHNTLADAFALNLVYVPFRVEQERVEEAVRGAYALNLLGCNVTVPYKSRVMPYLKEIDPLAERIGAVNTLVRIPGGFKGYNTDMPGSLPSTAGGPWRWCWGPEAWQELWPCCYGKRERNRSPC